MKKALCLLLVFLFTLLTLSAQDLTKAVEDGDTPLGEAARGGYLDVVQYLLAKGADVSLKDNDGSSAEDIAKTSGQAKVEALLKSHRK